MTAPQTPAGDDPDADDDTVFSQLDEAESLDDPDLADQLDEGVSPNEQPWGSRERLGGWPSMGVRRFCALPSVGSEFSRPWV